MSGSWEQQLGNKNVTVTFMLSHILYLNTLYSFSPSKKKKYTIILKGHNRHVSLWMRSRAEHCGAFGVKKCEGQMLFLPLQSSTRRANCHGRFNALTAPTWAANTSTVRQRANRKLFLEDGLFLEARQSFCAVRDSASMKRTSAFPLATPPHPRDPN